VIENGRHVALDAISPAGETLGRVAPGINPGGETIVPNVLEAVVVSFWRGPDRVMWDRGSTTIKPYLWMFPPDDMLSSFEEAKVRADGDLKMLEAATLPATADASGVDETV
jgi:hypothetical protein